MPFGNGSRWQLLQFENPRATPFFVGTHRIDGTVPSGNGSAFLKVSALLAAAINFASRDRKWRWSASSKTRCPALIQSGSVESVATTAATTTGCAAAVTHR